MPIAPGQTGRADDFIDKSEQDADPSNDEGRVAKLEADGRIHPDFSMPAGIFFPFAGASGSVPSGFLLCDGASYLSADYPDLFAAIGTLWGAADGTHFNVPNLKGRVPVGFDSSQTEFDAVGENGGAKTHTLTTNEMPSHTHVQNAHSHTVSGNTSGGSGGVRIDASVVFTAATSSVVATNQNTGGGAAHNNLQPYTTSHWVIKY